jgi:hypothetical protein
LTIVEEDKPRLFLLLLVAPALPVAYFYCCVNGWVLGLYEQFASSLPQLYELQDATHINFCKISLHPPKRLSLEAFVFIKIGRYALVTDVLMCLLPKKLFVFWCCSDVSVFVMLTYARC